MFIEQQLKKIDFYDLTGGVYGPISSNQTIFKSICVRDFELPDDVIGSVAIVDTPPTHEVVFSIQKNGSQFATITVDANSTTGIFEGVATEFSKGDILSIVAPPIEDSSLRGFWFTLMCFLK